MMRLMLHDTTLGNIFGSNVQEVQGLRGKGACSQSGAVFFNVHTQGRSRADISAKR